MYYPPSTPLSLSWRRISTAVERKTKTPPSYNGRRCPKIPASRPKVVSPTSLTPQPRNLPLHPRIHLDDMAESKRSPTASGESNYLSKEKHRYKSEEGPSYILCTPVLFLFLSHKTNIYIIFFKSQKEGRQKVPPPPQKKKNITAKRDVIR